MSVNITTEYRCACGLTMSHQEYRQHRQGCVLWIDATQRQMSLFKQYSERSAKPGISKWTFHAALILGVAFYRANGIMPNYRCCKTMYSMPDIKDVLRIFKTLEAFHGHIEQTSHMEG